MPYAPIDKLEDLVDRLDILDDGKNSFRNGDCAALALALYTFALETQCFQEMPYVSILFRIERDKEDDVEIERTISHVMFCTHDHKSLDIGGWDADNRWLEHLDDNITPWAHNAYNDTEYLDLTSGVKEALLQSCEPYGISLKRMPELLRTLHRLAQNM